MEETVLLRRYIYLAVINMYNCGLSAFSLGLIPSLRFVDVWGEVLGLLNKPLNVVWTCLCLLAQNPATFGARVQDKIQAD